MKTNLLSFFAGVILVILFSPNRCTTDKPTPQSTDLDAYFYEQIRNREIEIDLLNAKVSELENKRENIRVVYREKAVKVKELPKPEMQKFFNEQSETDNNHPFVNLDSIGAGNIANKLIEAEGLVEEITYLDSITEVKGKQISLLEGNTVDLKNVNKIYIERVVQLEKDVKKQKKRTFWNSVLFFAGGFAVSKL